MSYQKAKSLTAWMDAPKERNQFHRKLLEWYSLNRRELPWHSTRDPYRIWVSEIMLQQTRVAAVIPHYERFLRRFPTVGTLASAREPSVLAAWSGLGYYRRARMLHAAAKKVVRQHAGQFPGSAGKLRGLPGIGRYTSAAIASIAYGEPIALVDGNVRRVIERLIGQRLEENTIWKVADKLLCREESGEFNQSLMELGATICLPRGPKCSDCPVKAKCVTRASLPSVRAARKQVKRQIFCTLARRDDSIFLIQRPRDNGLMPGMWELPEAPKTPRNTAAIRLRHSITVTDFEVLVSPGAAPNVISGRWIKEKRLNTLPLTGLARKTLRAANVI